MDLLTVLRNRKRRLAHGSAAASWDTAPLPEAVELVFDGAGLDALAVKSGDLVQTGQDLARPGCGPLIATVTGRVAKVDCRPSADGRHGAAVTIATAAQEILVAQTPPLSGLDTAAPEALAAAMLRAGLPGLAALRRRAKLTTLIASALDEEPGCVINSELLCTDAEDLAAALRLWQRASGAGQVVLALAAGAAAPAPLPGSVRLARTPAVYPNGLPEILALRAGGWLFQETPAGPRGDTLVVGLEILLAGLVCLRDGRPFCEKTVSCLGPHEQRPRNVRVRIGAPAAQLLAQLELTPAAGGKLLLGGPLRGQACPEPAWPIRPDTHQLVLQEPGQVHGFSRLACTNCGLCSEHCPVGLDVHLLGRYAEYDRFDRCADLAVERCVDCGLCAYVCPAQRPLAQLMQHAKQTLWCAPERRQATAGTAGCNLCGPCCPAIRLFDPSADTPPPGQERQP